MQAPDVQANSIKLPFEGLLLLFTKTFFDKELSISENNVRPASILHNASLIMGKQIINVLPEGWVFPKLKALVLANKILAL